MAEETLKDSAAEGAIASPPAPSEAVAPAPTPVNAPSGPFRRTIEWFWRGKALKKLRAERKQESPGTRDLAERAQVLFALAERARHPTDPLPKNADAAAAELYRESAYYAVRALAHARGLPTGSAAWDAVDRTVLSNVCGDSERASSLTRFVEDGTFAETWELSKEERALRATALASLSKFLLGELAWHTRARDALWLQRVIRIGGLLAIVLIAVLVVRAVGDSNERKHDIAVGKAWRASSSAGMGCQSPQQQCGDGSDFFFHTTEERNPWVEIDLGRPTEISAIRIVNRRDCCFDRAVPMVLEVGNDPEHLKEVARRTTAFSSWRADFPKTTARYVRARVQGKKVLHLAEVRVLVP